MIADREFAPFSHATLDPAGRLALRNNLIVTAAQIQTTAFLRRHGVEVARTSSGLTDVLSNWCQCRASIHEAMLLPSAVRTIREADVDPVWLAATSAAHLHAAGRDGEWRATFAKPAPVRFGFRQTPPISDLVVSAVRGRVEVSFDGGPVVDLSTMDADVPSVRVNQVCVPILGPQTQRAFPVDDSVEFARCSLDEVVSEVAEARSILSQKAPAYLKWIEDALSAVVPVEPPQEGATQSFSLPGVHGVVFASFPTSPLKIAELLVHECSHQYFHFGLLDTLFSNGMDDALYWSPYVQKNRPIDRILIAFHAFANIVLFYRECLAAGESKWSQTAEMEIASNLEHLVAMSGYLQKSRGLSPTGRGHFDPQRDELFR